MQALEIIQTVVFHCWDILAFPIPGLGGATCQQFLIALMLINISIFASQFAFGIGKGGSGYRSGQSGKKRVSENRKGDEK